MLQDTGISLETFSPHSPRGASPNYASNYVQKQPPKVFCKPQPATMLKKRLWHRSFSVNFARF